MLYCCIQLKLSSSYIFKTLQLLLRYSDFYKYQMEWCCHCKNHSEFRQASFITIGKKAAGILSQGKFEVGQA